MNEHPTYSNPTIQEAVCEIRFSLPDGVEWKPALLGEMFKRIQPDFPDLEPVMQIGVQFQMGPDGAGQLVQPRQQLMRYKHSSRNLMLQLSKDILTVNVLPEYEGWAKMGDDIEYAWNAICEVVNPACVTRVGLRYINRIERTYPDELPDEWLVSSDYVPKSILKSLPGFLLRSETRIDPHNRVIVTLGDPGDGSGQSGNAIILDIDHIVEKEIGVDRDAIMIEAVRLHELVWSIFSASITPRLERRLKGVE